MIVKFNEFDSSLGTRRLGNSIRNDISQNLDDGLNVTFDFDGVELISNSFADECFGKLVDRFGIESLKQRTTFVNANRKVSLVLSKAISDRIAFDENSCCIKG